MADKNSTPNKQYDNEWLILYVFIIVMFMIITKNS